MGHILETNGFDVKYIVSLLSDNGTAILCTAKAIISSFAVIFELFVFGFGFKMTDE